MADDRTHPRIRADPEAWARVKAAASLSGKPVEEWAAEVLLREADKVLARRK